MDVERNALNGLKRGLADGWRRGPLWVIKHDYWEKPPKLLTAGSRDAREGSPCIEIIFLTSFPMASSSSWHESHGTGLSKVCLVCFSSCAVTSSAAPHLVVHENNFEIPCLNSGPASSSAPALVQAQETSISLVLSHYCCPHGQVCQFIVAVNITVYL